MYKLHLIYPQVSPAAHDIFEPTFIERLFVYMKIKDHLRLAFMTDDKTEEEQLRDMALRLSLEYHLVTPLTSFIIVQQEKTQRMQEDGVMRMSPNMVSSTFLSGGSPGFETRLASFICLCTILMYHINI